MNKLYKENIREKVRRQGNIIVDLNRDLEREYKNFYNLIIKKSNVILDLIISKLPNIKMIPLFCSYFDEYNREFVNVEALSIFEDYALDNKHLTEEDLKLINKELIELYFLVDILIHHMNNDINNNKYDLIYGCVDGDSKFFITKSLKNCFNE